MCDLQVKQVNYFTMKKMIGNSEEKMNFNSFGFDVLNEKEMLNVRGGGDVKPKTRDVDVFDLEDE